MRLDLDKLLERVDLVELVQRESAVKLKQHGHSFRGRCPIHGGDNDTAFNIYENGGYQLWHCHTRCAGGGDAVQFVRRLRNLEWIEALKWLADYAHLPLAELGMTPERVQEHQARERRADVLDLAAQFYRQHFRGNTQARDYVAGRAFAVETAQAFGFSDGRGLAEWLRDHHADLDLARELGLLRKDGFDFTANANGQAASPTGWLVYIHLEGGRVRFFSARAVTPAAEMPDPKDKSRNLPGDKHLYRAEVRGDRGVVIVEGQADAESFRQLGRSSWALCGKAMSEDDVAGLRKRKPIYLALDNDAAGQERVAAIAGQLGPLCMMLPALPGGAKDANAWLQAGATTEALSELQKAARPWIDLVIDSAREAPAYALDERIGELCAQIAALPETMQGRYLKAAEAAVGVPIKDLRARMKNPALDGQGPIVSDVKDGRLCFLGEPLGNFQAAITHELTVEDGLNPPTVRYTLQGQLVSGDRLNSVEVPADEFPGLGWIGRHWGARPLIYVSPSRQWSIRRAIQEISLAAMKREHVYTFTGWTMLDGVRSFLTSSGAITAEGYNPDVRVDLGQGNLGLYALPAPPEDPRQALQASIAFLDLAPLTVTAPLWAAMYAAPLTPFRVLYSTLWVYGSSQSLKSTLAMLALTHFGQGFTQGREPRSPKDWLSTFTDLEGAAFALKDVPLVIDDFAPQNSLQDANAIKQRAHLLLRSVGNRSARGRANADLTARAQRPPRGIVIATAEKLLGGVQSIEGRMLAVAIGKMDVKRSGQGEPPGALDEAQRSAGAGGPGLYGQAMAAYVRWIARYWDQHQAQLATEYEAAAQQARATFPPNWSRLMDYYAVLVVAARTALRFALRSGAIDQARHDQLALETIPAALVDLITRQDQRISEQSPARRFCEAMSDLLVQQRVYLSKRNAETASPPAPGAEMVGWYDATTPVVYLLSTVALGKVREYWIRAGEVFDVPREALHREIEQAGLIKQRSKDQLTASIWVSKEHGTQRVLALDDNRVEAEYGVNLWPDKLTWEQPPAPEDL